MELAVFATAALAMLLVLLAAADPVARRVGLPLPVVIATAGLLYGTGAEALGTGVVSRVLDGYTQWFVDSLAFDGSTLLLVFLPPLLFEMALAVNVRRLLDDVGAVAILAVVAVAVATVVVGFSVWALSPLGLVACLLLGAAVSTTDPGAVIVTFRDIGAPRRLLSLLEGESLLNDAAAIALFALLLGVIESGAATAADLAGGFATAFGVGAAVGLGAAFLAARLYPLLGASAAAETSATVALAYGAHIAAEAAGGSGVVAVVCAGLLTGSAGFVRMGPRNWTTVRAVWGQIGFWANGLILFLVAALTPGLLLDLTPGEAALAVVVWIGALAARAAVLFGLMPVLERAGWSAVIEPRQKLLALWGGVRGAVTLVLALSLTDVAALGEDAQVLGAIAAVFALMTLAINAATLAFATRLLGLDALSPADVALRERIAAGAIDRVNRVAAELARARDIDPEAVEAVTRALVRRRAEAEAEAEAAGEGARIPFGERLRLGLAILGGQEARLIRRGFEDGAIGPRVTLLLRAKAELLADAARTGGRAGYEGTAIATLRDLGNYRFAFLLHRWLQIDRPLRERMELRQTALLETERVLRDLDRFAETRLPPMIGDEATANLRALLTDRLDRVGEEIDSMALQYPDYALALETALIARAAARRERLEYERLHQDGVIGPELRQDLMRELDARERVAGAPPRLDLTLAPADLLDRAPMFHRLSAAQRRRIAKRMRARVTYPGEVVAASGDRDEAMCFIASGALEMRGAGEPVRMSNGDFFGALSFFRPGRRRTTDVVSLGFGRLLILSRLDFQKLAKRDPEIAGVIREAAERRFGGVLGAARRSGADPAPAGKA